MKDKWVLAFTLVELLVVFAIIAVLGTISFVTFSGYSADARDTTRAADVKNMNNILTLHHAIQWKYPLPSDGVAITYSGSLAWTQWVFGTGTQAELGKIIGALEDPKHGNQYSYSVTQTQTEYQLWVVFENEETSLNNPLALKIPNYSIIDTTHASSYYDLASLNPKIWLDGEDIDGDWDFTDNPANGASITTWVNKWSIGAAWNPTITHGDITYWEDAMNGINAPFIEKDDGLRFDNSDITQWEIYYVLHDSGWKVSWYALQGTVKKYAIGAYSNYRNSLRINSAPSHLSSAPAIKNSMRRKPFFYSFVTDGSNYEFRNSWNLISQWATNSITGITWALNKAWWESSTSRLADWGIWEVLIFDTELSEDDKFKVEGYLAHKWALQDNLPADHPYKDEPPITATPVPDPIEPSEKTGVYVYGNYNKLFVHSENGGTHYVIPTPSIMASDITTSTDLTEIISNKKLSYHAYGNIPASYADAWIDFESWFDFYSSAPSIFEWTRDELVSYNSIKEIDSWIVGIYSNFVEYKDVSYALEDNSMQYIERILGDVVGINPIKPFYCSDILESGLTRNIAQKATIKDGLWTSIELLNNLDTDIEGEYTATRENETIVIEFPEVEEVWYIKIYNTISWATQSFSWAEVRLFDENDVILYSHTLWDTTSDYVIELDLEWIGEKHELQSIDIQVPVWETFVAREIEVYSAGNIQNGYYKVDDDGIWGKWSYEVYCDMETDDGGWTRIGTNLLQNGRLSDGQHVLNYSLSDSGKNNVITKLNPWNSPYVLEQKNFAPIPNSNIKYELLFDDIESMKEGREIRLAAWVAYDGGVSTADIFDFDLLYDDATTATWTILETIDTINIWGADWERKQLRIPLTKTVQSFVWNLWEWIPKTSTQKLYVVDMLAEIFLK